MNWHSSLGLLEIIKRKRRKSAKDMHFIETFAGYSKLWRIQANQCVCFTAGATVVVLVTPDTVVELVLPSSFAMNWMKITIYVVIAATICEDRIQFNIIKPQPSTALISISEWQLLHTHLPLSRVWNPCWRNHKPKILMVHAESGVKSSQLKCRIYDYPDPFRHCVTRSQ